MFDQAAKGLSSAEIASVLFILEATVKTHVVRLLSRLQLRDRVQPVVFAYGNGVVGGERRGVRRPATGVVGSRS